MNIKEKLQTLPAITQAVGVSPLCHIKLLPFQGARCADMNTQGECPGLGASAPSGCEWNCRGVKGIAGMREGEWRLIC